MNPLLFESYNIDETFSFAICELVDCTRCTISENLAGEYTAEVGYTTSGAHYELIKDGMLLVCAIDGTGERDWFRINSRTVAEDGSVTFYCNALAYDLRGVIALPKSYASAAAFLRDITDITDAYASQVNVPIETFYMETDLTGLGGITIDKPANLFSLINGPDGSLRALYGGELIFRGNEITWTARRGADNGFEVVRGQNLIKLTATSAMDDAYNAVMAYWLDESTGQMVLGSDFGEGGYGRAVQYVNLGDAEVGVPWARWTNVFLLNTRDLFDSSPDEQQLINAAESYYLANLSRSPGQSVTVDIGALWQLDEYEAIARLQTLSLGDTVHVIDPDIGLNTTLRVTKTVFDSLAERFDSLEIGVPQESFAQVSQEGRIVDGTTETTTLNGPVIFGNEISVGAGKLLKTVRVTLTATIRASTDAAQTGNGTQPVNAGSGWTPLCVGGFTISSSAVNLYRLYLDGDNVAFYYRHTGTLSSDLSLTIRADVLCLHTGVMS